MDNSIKIVGVMKKKTNVSSVLINQPKQRLCAHCLQSTCIVNVCGYFYDNEKEKNLSVRRSTFFNALIYFFLSPLLLLDSRWPKIIESRGSATFPISSFQHLLNVTSI